MHDLSTAGDQAEQWERLRPVIDDALGELNSRDREAVLLRFFSERSYGEIGGTLNVSENTARMRVERALDKLHGLLSRRGITTTSAALTLSLSAHGSSLVLPTGLASAVATNAIAQASGLTMSAAVLKIMSSSKFAYAGAAAVLALAITFTGVEIHAARSAQDDLRVADTQIAALNEQLRDVQVKIDVASAAERTSAEQRREAAQRAAVVRRDARAAFFQRHPEIREVLREQWRATADGQYRPLFRSLRLTPEQIERMKDLLAQGVGSMITVGDGERVIYRTDGDHSTAMAELRQLLGEEGFRQYQEYDRLVLPAWQMTIQVAGALFDTEAPLTSAQGESLLGILANHRVPDPTGVGRPPFDWPAIMPLASQALSPRQVAVLDAYRAEDECHTATVAAIRRRQPATDAGKPALR